MKITKEKVKKELVLYFKIFMSLFVINMILNIFGVDLYKNIIPYIYEQLAQ